jgi:uncharacterized protein (TIGR02246 family)
MTPGQSAEDAIRKLDEEFMKAANAKDAAALVKLFYADNAALMPPNHPIVEGRANIQTYFQGLMDGGFKSITLSTPKIESSGDLAYGRGVYQLSLAPPGGAPIEDVGKYVVTYRRQSDGSWKAVADIFNSDKAAA